MGINGADVLVLVDTGTEFEVVASQRDVTFNRNTNIIDLSSKDDKFEKVLAGRLSQTMTLDYLYVPDSASYQALSAAWENQELVQLKRQEQGDITKEGEAVVESMSESFPDQGPGVISATFRVSGAWLDADAS